MDWTDGCILLKVIIANFAAFNSKTFMWHVHDALALCPWQIALQLTRQLAIITWGKAEIIDFPLAKWRCCTHQSSSAFTSPDKVIFELQSSVSCNSKICCRCMARYCGGAGRTAIAVDARRPINWLSSLMEADELYSRSWHCYTVSMFDCENWRKRSSKQWLSLSRLMKSQTSFRSGGDFMKWNDNRSN